jgi:hypothetical protein
VNIFSTEAFLETLGAQFFPRRRWDIALRRVEGRVLRLLVLDGRTVVRRAPFYDFPQPLELAVGADASCVGLSYFPRTVICTNTLSVHVERLPGTQPSPFIEWRHFKDAKAFESHAEKSGARLSDSRRQRRRLAENAGPLTFEFDDPRESVFDAALAWKSAQYLASGYRDLFAQPACVELFRALRRRGLLVVNSLHAGSTLVAAHLGSLHDGRFTWWVPSYDPAFATWSPGRLLLEDALRESQARGHVEFDFLIGDEKYKYHYATHERVIGPLGTPGLLERLELDARGRVRTLLASQPRVGQFVRGLRARFA